MTKAVYADNVHRRRKTRAKHTQTCENTFWKFQQQKTKKETRIQQ